MSDLSKQTLLSLRDFIGDALSDPEVTPQEIAKAIIDELTELTDYHANAHSKAKETLALFSKTDDISDAWTYFVKDTVGDDWTWEDDTITSAELEHPFKLSSDYLNINAADTVDLNETKDVLDFKNYKNKKNKNK